MNITEEDARLMADRISAMSQAEKLALDEVAYALSAYGKAANQKGWRVIPDRVLALAAVELMWEWEQLVWTRE